MNFDTNLELQLEILTLVKNIKQFNNNGWCTDNLKKRLKICRSKQRALSVTENKSLQGNYLTDTTINVASGLNPNINQAKSDFGFLSYCSL
jgi:hypothetical protein